MSFYDKHLSHYFIREINLYDNVADELALHGQAVLESICADPIICIEEVLESYDIKETKMDQETIPETDLKVNMPLLKAKFQEYIKLVEEDPALLKLFGGAAVKKFKVVFEEVMPRLFPEVPTSSFSEENYLQDSENNFDDFTEAIKSKFSNAFDIRLD